MPKVQPQTRLLPVYQVRLERIGSIRYADRDVRNPRDVSELARAIVAEEIGTYDREHFVAVYPSAKHRPVGYSVVSIGSLTATIVHPREIMKVGILTNAQAFIVAHNHPSGDPTPSREDREVTSRLRDAGHLMGIELLDHVILGEGRYVSFQERGYLHD